MEPIETAVVSVPSCFNDSQRLVSYVAPPPTGLVVVLCSRQQRMPG